MYARYEHAWLFAVSVSTPVLTWKRYTARGKQGGTAARHDPLGFEDRTMQALEIDLAAPICMTSAANAAIVPLGDHCHLIGV